MESKKENIKLCVKLIDFLPLIKCHTIKKKGDLFLRSLSLSLSLWTQKLYQKKVLILQEEESE